MSNGSPADDVFIQKLQSFIQAKLSDSEFGVTELAREAGMSRSSLHRKVKSELKKSASQFICLVRLRKAHELLMQNSFTISEIAYNCGFNSVTYFNKCFHDYYGCSPGEAAKREVHEIFDKENKESNIHSKWDRKKILIGGIFLMILITVLVVVIFVNLLGSKTKNLPKTIAVLPFYNDSQDSTNMYVINGIMDGIITRLSKISDINVLPRSSVEFFRKNRPKSNKQIAKELDVKYIVDGSGQKTGEQLKITINLMEGETNKLLVSESFIKTGEEILNLESEIAMLIANRLEAKITHEEKTNIEERPTSNITAYNLYLQAGEIWALTGFSFNKTLYQQAENLIREAIRLDSTFSEAYAYLGWIIAMSKENYDTAMHLANRSLHFDNKNPRAHYLKGWIYTWHSNPIKLKEAEEECKLAVKYSNGLTGIRGLGDVYFQKRDFLKGLEYEIKDLKNNKESGDNVTLGSICGYISGMGLNEEALTIADKITKPGSDSLAFFRCEYWRAIQQSDFHGALRIVDKTAHEFAVINFQSTIICVWLRDYKSALKYVEEYDKYLKKQSKEINARTLAGYIYLKNGNKEKADFHLKGALNNQLKYIEEIGQEAGQGHYVYLASIYSALGDKGMALKTLEKALKCEEIDHYIFELTDLKYNPIYETIADEPKFKRYISGVESRFYETQTKVRELLKKEWKVLGVD